MWKNLLLLPDVEDQTTGLDVKEFNLQRVLRAAVAEDMAGLARERNLSLTLLADEALMIPGDEQKLKQVFLNLLDNAIKYTPPHGAVSVSAVPAAADMVHITVQDTGIGIPPRNCPIFLTAFIGWIKHGAAAGLALA